ncbi:glycoside hydrolase family 108 protein [Burkholderia stagnalis]|uniref:glycoside hydrolase family 108 protein n=1 Tax=Burkholderia stagnalis TaxID=1503054 RepID=UPI000F80BECE|nr:glycosyl hydrolase 108 family protein [Burkholderia stagnalis]
MEMFDQAFALVVGIEGGFSTDQNDPGNWTGGKVGVGVFKGTKYGISAAAYPNLDIENLTLDQSKALFETDYWQLAACDRMPWPLALFVFDCAVNQGVGAAKMTLQQAVGVAVDGVIGPVTLAAAQNADAEHVALFMASRGIRYTHSPIFPGNGLGWFKRLFLLALNHGGANGLG